MAKSEWGEKHRCSSCGRPFYDMKRNPMICPSCGEKHVPVKLLKSRKTSSASAKALVKKVVPPKLEDDLDEDNSDVPVEDNVSVDDDGEDDGISAVVVPKPTTDDT